jgi:hypothetical protein
LWVLPVLAAVTMCLDLLYMLDDARTFPALEPIWLRQSEKSDATYGRRGKLKVF